MTKPLLRVGPRAVQPLDKASFLHDAIVSNVHKIASNCFFIRDVTFFNVFYRVRQYVKMPFITGLQLVYIHFTVIFFKRILHYDESVTDLSVKIYGFARAAVAGGLHF